MPRASESPRGARRRRAVLRGSGGRGPSCSPASPAGPAPGAASSRLTLRASPVFGTDAASGEGWLELVVYVDDAGASPAKGTLEVDSTYGGFTSSSEGSLRRPRAVPRPAPRRGGDPLPVRAGAYSGASMTISAVGDDGAKLAETTLSLGRHPPPLLVDVDDPSRLSVVMRGWPVTPAWRAPLSPVRVAGFDHAVDRGFAGRGSDDGRRSAPGARCGLRASRPSSSCRRSASRASRARSSTRWWAGCSPAGPSPSSRHGPEDLRAGTLTTLVGGRVTPGTAPAGR